jgi:diacylglycerol kinase family enzyme
LVNEALRASYPTLIAGGGDGTLRGVVEAMLLAKTTASLALLPLGTANDFSRAAGVPLEPLEALQLFGAPAQAIDLGEVDGQLFLNMATGDFGSNVTANTREDLKQVLGGAAYFLTGLTRFTEVNSSFGRFKGADFA